MTPVTNSALLEKLNDAPVSGGEAPVTDKALLSRLDGPVTDKNIIAALEGGGKQAKQEPLNLRQVPKAELAERGFMRAFALPAQVLAAAGSTPFTVADKIAGAIKGEPVTSARDAYFKATGPAFEVARGLELDPAREATDGAGRAVMIGSELAGTIPQMFVMPGQVPARTLPLLKAAIQARAPVEALRMAAPALESAVVKGAPFIVPPAIDTGAKVAAAGGDTEDVLRVAGTQAAATVPAVALPLSAAGGVVKRAVTGALLGAPANLIQQEMTNRALGDEFKQLQTDTLDPENLTTQTVIPAALAAVFGPRAAGVRSAGVAPEAQARQPDATPVADPALISKLENVPVSATDSAVIGGAENASAAVTDPAIISRLDATAAVSDPAVIARLEEPGSNAIRMNEAQGDSIPFGRVDGAGSAQDAAAKPSPSLIRTDPVERLMSEKYEGGGQLYSGIPLDRAGDTIKFAGNKLGDALGIPDKGVTVESFTGRPRDMGVFDQFRSPSALVTKYPELKPYVEGARRAQIEMDTLRDAFGRRLQYVDRQLGGSLVSKAGDLGGNYRKNKSLMNELLLEGDFTGKRFTQAELKARGVPDGVIKAYEGIRSAYDHALTIANKTRELRGKDAVSRREGYVPHFFHDYMVKVDGNIVASARTLRDAVSIANSSARKGAENVTVIPKGMKFPGEDTQAAMVGDATYFKLKDAMEDAFSMTPEQANAMLQDIARMRGRSRVVGNFLERKGAPGWEKNLDYAHQHYFNMISRYAALDKFKSSAISNFEMRFGQFDKEHKGLQSYVKNYINDINGVPTRVEELLNSAIAGTPGMNQFAKTYLGKRPALEMATATTNAVAIAKLGLYNVSSALVNLSQLNMANTLLGPKWMAKGLARAAKVETELSKRKFGFGGDTTSDIGILRQLDVPVQQGLENSGAVPDGAFGKVFKASTWFFNNVEFTNRAATSLGAYYKALDDGMSKADALAYARDINRRVNFDYSAADAPNFIRRSGPAGQVLFQFKKFPIKSMEFMASLKGAEHAKFWIPLALVSGYYAFPGMEAVKNMVSGLFGIDIEMETKDYLIRWAGEDPEKKAIAKTIFYGAFANDQLGGVDISRRVGSGDFIPSESTDLMGPFFSSVVRATQMASGEHWAEALRAIATAPGNIAIALKNDGELTSPWDRDRLTSKLDNSGQVKKALGLATVGESTERDTARVMRYGEKQQRQKEVKAIDDFIKSFSMKDQAGIDRAIGTFAELGMGEGTGDRIKTEMLKKGMTVSERAFSNLSKQGKARQIPILEHAN